MEFPIIDIARIDDPELSTSYSQRHHRGEPDLGLSLAKNHPIPLRHKEMFEIGREFFINVPEEQKAPWPITTRYVGYNGALSDRKKDTKRASGSPENRILAEEGYKACRHTGTTRLAN